MRLLFKLCILLAPILFATGYVEHELVSVPNGYNMKRDRIEQRILGIEVLITGSSHSFYGIRPKALNQNAFSLAYISQDLFYDTRLLLKYAPKAPNLKLVIIPISYFSLESKLENTVERWRCPFYHIVFGFPVVKPLDIANYSLIALYGASESQSLMFRRFKPRSTELIEDDGGPPHGLQTVEKSDLSSDTTLARHEGSMRFSLIYENVSYINEAVETLERRGVAVVFITTPVYKSYYSRLNQSAYKRMQETIGAMRAQNGIHYYNYMEDSRFDEADFADCDHLNASGMAKFTEILKNEVVDPSIASATIMKESNSGPNGVKNKI